MKKHFTLLALPSMAIAGGAFLTNLLPVRADEVETRLALETIYSSMEQGLQKKDIKAVTAPETADFTLKGPDGKTYDHDAATARWEQQIGLVKDIHSVIFKIDTVTGADTGATVDAIETIAATFNDEDGNAHDALSTMKVRDTWTKVDKDWKLKHQESIWQVITVDGQRVEGP